MAATTDGAGKPGSFGAAKAATGGLFGATLKSGLDKLLIHVKVQNRLRPAIPHNGEEVVPDVTIELVGVKLGSDSVPAGALANKVVTNRKGEANLDLGAMTDGTFTLSVESKYSSAEDVGPGFKPAGSADRVFRRLMLTVTANDGIVTKTQVFGGWEKNGTAQVTKDGKLVVELQPIWMQIGHGSRNSYTNPDLIVVHRSGDLAPRSFHIWVNDNIGPHYAIDADGQIVKLVRDEHAAWHAKGGVWNGRADVNYRSIGIEMINKEPTKYTPEQYASLLTLLQSLRKAFPSIPAQAFVGHTDVDVPHYRQEDPGKEFDWEFFEKNGIGLAPDFAPIDLANLYGGFFAAVPLGRLKAGDSDKDHRFGGKVFTPPKPAAREAWISQAVCYFRPTHHGGRHPSTGRREDGHRQTHRRASEGPERHRLRDQRDERRVRTRHPVLGATLPDPLQQRTTHRLRPRRKRRSANRRVDQASEDLYQQAHPVIRFPLAGSAVRTSLA